MSTSTSTAPSSSPDAGAAQTDDPSITGLAVLRACLQYAQANPAQQVVITGHTDKQLGYYQGDVDGQPSDLSTAAIEGFQEDQDLPQTGELDAPTVDALRSAYGS